MIRTITQEDEDWIISSGLTIAPRAGFRISNNCPREYRMILLDCLKQGWLAPVANVYEKDLTWEKINVTD